MKVYHISAWEEWVGSDEYDDGLRSVAFDEDYLLSELSDYIDANDDKYDDLLDFISEYAVDETEYNDLSYDVFYNRTTRLWDVRVQFDFVSRLDLRKFDKHLDVVLVFEGNVDRVSSTFNDTIAEWLSEKITNWRLENETQKKVLDFLSSFGDEEDKEALEEFISDIQSIQLDFLSYSMKDFRDLPTVAEDIDELLYNYEDRFSIEFYNRLGFFLDDCREEEIMNYE
ncbi:hypothetical protein AB3329_01945 [Streptococcus sp. H31]|uniref:hypothetical protein n=1 Tax=Streptococcus huangxiaojuni TaxID=3237239 RepID=UPI0034A31B98